MRLSVSLRSRYGRSDPRRGAREMVERTVAARDAGLDALYLGDHHSVPSGYHQNSPMLGRLLAEWRGTTGALYLLPLWHPVLVAEHVATLASIAPGRFILQCGLGGGREQFGAMGTDLQDRVPRFESALDIVRRLLNAETVTESDPYPVREARIGPLPPEPVEIWLAGHAPRALDRAARMADGWVAGPQASIEEAMSLADAYRQACARHGRAPGTIAVRRDVFVGRDRADAHRVAKEAQVSGYRGFDPTVLVIGERTEVRDRLQRLADAGVDEVVIRHVADDQDDVLASFARLGPIRDALL